MFGECHAHMLMDGVNYREAVARHRDAVCEEKVREFFEAYQRAGVSFIRDGGDNAGVSKRASEIAGEYGIDYRTPIFAVHKEGHYGRIVGHSFSNIKEFHQRVQEAAEEGADFIKIMTTGLLNFNDHGAVTGTPLDRDEVREMVHIAHEEACTKSIQDLRCDYVDLYFIHWPFPNYHAPFCDVDSRNPDSRPFSVEEFMDTYRQCEELVEKGKIRYIGISNMTIPKLEAVLPLMKIKPAACELELHPCFQQQEQYDYLVAHNIQPVGYMPLGSPRRPERDICPEDVADMQTPEMQEIAKAHGVHPALIALKWAHQRGEISIPFSVHNYVSNLKCVTEDPLTDEEMAKIGTLEKGNRLVKGQVFLWEGAKDWHDLWDEEGFIVK